MQACATDYFVGIHLQLMKGDDFRWSMLVWRIIFQLNYDVLLEMSQAYKVLNGCNNHRSFCLSKHCATPMNVNCIASQSYSTVLAYLKLYLSTFFRIYVCPFKGLVLSGFCRLYHFSSLEIFDVLGTRIQ